jgi:putative lipoic acid-binding regulatory protein
MDDDSLNRLKTRLDENLAWPCLYTFKFIVPMDMADKVAALFPEGHTIRRRPSKKNNYVGLTAEMLMNNSSDVIALYRKASVIKGILCL